MIQDIVYKMDEDENDDDEGGSHKIKCLFIYLPRIQEQEMNNGMIARHLPADEKSQHSDHFRDSFDFGPISQYPVYSFYQQSNVKCGVLFWEKTLW